jgi:hypothetical protein
MGFKYDTSGRRNKNAPRKASGIGMILIFIVLGISAGLGWWLPTQVPLHAYLPFVTSWSMLTRQIVTGLAAFTLLQFLVVLIMGVITPPRPRDEYEEDARRAMSQYVESRMGKRPVGITLLGTLYVILGFLGAVGCIALLVFRNAPPLQIANAIFAQLGLSSTLLFIWGGVLSLLYLAAGIGLWSGDRWGWWLGGFLQAYGALQSAAALLAVAGVVQQPAGPAPATQYYIQYGGQTVGSALVFLYYFKTNVVEYFRLRRQSKLAALAILVAAAVIVLIAWQAALQFFQPR